MHNLLFCAHTLCMNYVINTFLLVSSSVRSKQLLCFVHGQGQKREQKPTTKKVVGFHNHSPLLTMVHQRNLRISTTLSILRKYAEKVLCTKTPLSRGVTGKTFTDMKKKQTTYYPFSDWDCHTGNPVISKTIAMIVQCLFKQNLGSSKVSAALNLFCRSKRTCHPFICQSKNFACYFPIL